MRKYDFKCKVCDLVIETDDPDIAPHCPKDSTQMKRVYSFGGTILKGGGWYSVEKRRTDGGTIGIEDPT